MMNEYEWYVWREEIGKKFWVLDGNLTHDLPDTSRML